MYEDRNELFEIETLVGFKTACQGYLVNETEKAAQFNIECFQGKFRTIWLPKSAITFYQNTFDKRIYDIIIPTWLAKSKKLF